MLTDKEKFIALMKEFGLAPEEIVDTKEFNRIPGTTHFNFETIHPKVVGYSSSCAEFVFNPDGSFKEVGVWEI